MTARSALWSKLRLKAVIGAFPVIHRVDQQRHDLIRIGSEYGGWWVPRDLLDATSICYTAGVGTDITFDTGLITQFGCRVWGIDPTPEAIEFVERHGQADGFTLVPVGLFGEDGTQKFFVPQNRDHVSHSLKNLQGTDDYFEAPVVTVRTLRDQLGHDRIDLLKLDIEGAEHDTVRRMLIDGIEPRVLCIEYDQPEPVAWSIDTTKILRDAGYALVKVDGLNLTFVRA